MTSKPKRPRSIDRTGALCLALLFLLTACGTPAPPTSRRVVAHESVADSGGTMLIVDVCLNHSPLGVDDYFVVSNARRGADALTLATTQFFAPSEVRIESKLVPFVCGALHDSGNAPKRVADAIDGDVSTRPQPLWVSPEIAADLEYVNALQVLSTFIFERALARINIAESAPGAEPGATPATVRDAAAVVARRSGRSSLLYVGATGHSLSSGKAAALGVARIAAGVALSVAVGPVFTAGGTSYGVIFVPGGPVDKRQLVAALFDLRSSAVVRSNVVRGGGDPMDPAVLSSRETMQLLLRDVAFNTARN